MCDKIERGTFLCMHFVFTLHMIRNLIMSFKRYISEHLRKKFFEKKRPYAIYDQHDELATSLTHLEYSYRIFIDMNCFIQKV